MAELVTKNTIVPYETLIGKSVTQPILSEEILELIEEALVPITHAKQWMKFMDQAKKKGTKILLTGPPGCGKTTIAYWIAKKVSNGIISMTMADIGGSEPGSGERAIREIFRAGAKEDNATICLDECDALLWSREKAGPDSMWMLGIINQLLLQIENYKGVVILATNFAKILDPALKRRLDFILTVPLPSYSVRQELWSNKIPESYPCQLNQTQLNEIAKIKLTGSEIETIINRTTRKALRLGKHPTYSDLFTAAQKYEGENRGEGSSD